MRRRELSSEFPKMEQTRLVTLSGSPSDGAVRLVDLQHSYGGRQALRHFRGVAFLPARFDDTADCPLIHIQLGGDRLLRPAGARSRRRSWRCRHSDAINPALVQID